MVEASAAPEGRQAKLWGAADALTALRLPLAAAFVLVSRRLEVFEIVGVLLRDIVAAVAFAVTLRGGHPSSIPARAGGKAVTLAQNLTLLAFVAGSEFLRPMAWATTGIAMYAIWDYIQARSAQRPVGT